MLEILRPISKNKSSSLNGSLQLDQNLNKEGLMEFPVQTLFVSKEDMSNFLDKVGLKIEYFKEIILGQVLFKKANLVKSFFEK